jgi:hypothetical protein
LRGLTSPWINSAMILTPKIDQRRAVFVLGKIHDILSWEKTKEQEKDARLSNSANICARCERGSIGGLRISNHSTNSWKSILPILGERLTT